MKKIFTLFTIGTMFLSLSSQAQKQVTLAIQNLIGSVPYTDKIVGTNDLSHSFKITRVDYYISSISIIHDGGMQTPVPNKYILVTGATNSIETLGTFNVTNVEGIKFSIGVDAAMNHNDPSLQIATHPLAPKNPSMHWGWSSGYRFIAVEGKGGSAFTTTFELHGLGDANYFSQTIMASGVNNGNDVTFNLDADYNKALKTIDVNVGPIFHGVNTIDLIALQNFRDFVFSPGAGIPNSTRDIIKEGDVSIYPNPSQGNIHVSIKNQIVKVNSISIIDITGRSIKEISLDNKTEIDFQLNSKGFYLMKLNQENNVVAVRKLVIE